VSLPRLWDQEAALFSSAVVFVAALPRLGEKVAVEADLDSYLSPLDSSSVIQLLTTIRISVALFK
jgi:hypothetical protein